MVDQTFYLTNEKAKFTPVYVVYIASTYEMQWKKTIPYLCFNATKSLCVWFEHCFVSSGTFNPFSKLQNITSNSLSYQIHNRYTKSSCLSWTPLLTAYKLKPRSLFTRFKYVKKKFLKPFQSHLPTFKLDWRAGQAGKIWRCYMTIH